MLELRLFGGLAIDLDGRPLPPPDGRPARAVLAWLALNPGRHLRSSVAARFWPDVLDTSARTSLRSALTAIRKALGPAGDALEATREHVGLRADVWVDALAFEQLIRDGRAGDAVALARGELLADLDDDWVFEAREAARRALGDAYGQLADEAEARGDAAAAAEHARARVALDPLAETAQQALIRRLWAQGDRAGALAAYDRFRRLLLELRLAPSPETRALVEELRGPAAGTPPATPRRLPPLLVPRGEVPLVGRTAELAVVRAALARASAGRRSVVVITGEPGIGKTRLAAALCAEALAAGASVLAGGCREEAIVPFGPFTEALTAHAASTPPERLQLEAGTGAAELARLGPSLAARLGTEAPPLSEDAEGARYRLFEAVASMLAAIAAPAPAVLVLDDLQWADRPTLLLLEHVIRSPADAALLLVLTARDAEVDPAGPVGQALAALARVADITRVRLAGLDADAVAALVAAYGGTGEQALLGELQERTEGNPFFIEELLSNRAETGQLGLPDGVVALLGRRLGRLSRSARTVLCYAALAGGEFTLATLEHVPELAGHDPLASLEQAVRARLVVEQPEAGAFAFAHGLVREALVVELTASRRGRIHLGLAQAYAELERGAPGRYGDRLAHHLCEALPAGDPERAVEAAEQAGEAAVRRLAYEDGAAWFERALAARGNPARVGRLLLALGDARMRAGATAEARRAFAEAAAEARAAGDASLLAEAALGHGGLGVSIVTVDEATVALLEEALAAPDLDDALRARLLARLAVELYYRTEPGIGEPRSREAVTIARRSGDPRALLQALNARRVALWSPDHLAARLEVATEMAELAEREGNGEALLQARNWRVVDLLELGDVDGVDREIDAYEALADHLRLPAYRWYTPLWRAMRALLEGRFEDAERAQARAEELGRPTGDANVAMFLWIQRGLAGVARGRPEPTDEVMALLRDRARVIGAAETNLATIAWLEAVRGDDAAARETLAGLSARLDRVRRDANLLTTLADLAEACALLEDAPLAARALDMLRPFAGHAVVVGRACFCCGSASYYLALLAATAGDPAQARAHLDASLRFHESITAAPWIERDRRLAAAIAPVRRESARRPRP